MYRKIDDKDKALVVSAVRGGAGYEQAARMVGVHGATAKEWCLKAGVKRPEKQFDCPGCKYRRVMQWNSGQRLTACHYSLDEDKDRGCSAQECYEKRARFRGKGER